MNTAIAYGDSMVFTFTGYSGYTTSDDSYEAAVQAAENFAAASILRRFLDDRKKATELTEDAHEICRGIRASGVGLFISTQSYRTTPLNPDASIFKSLGGGQNSTDDSDL